MRKLQHNINLIKVQAAGLWNKKRYMLAPMFFVCLTGWFFVSNMDNQYETKARVYADTTNILRPLLQGLAVQENIQGEVKITARTLLSRDVREEIAKRSDLHLLHPTPEGFEALISSLEDDIKISGSKANDVYDITYRHSNPQIAMEVVKLTMQKFVDASSGKSREDARSANEFLSSTLRESEQKLLELEKRLAVFKQENQEHLPGQGNSYYGELSSIQRDIEQANTNITTKKAMLEGLRSRFVPSQNDQDNTSSDIVVETPYDERLLVMETRLDQLRIKYTDKYPAIQELLANIDFVKKLQVASQEKILKQASAGAITASRTKNGSALQEFSFKISELSAEIDQLKAARKLLEDKLLKLEANLNKIPEVEAKLVELTRDYENMQTYHQELLSRKASAELSKSADEKTENVKFKVLEAPRVALKPVGPPRLLFYTAILLLGLGAGVGAAFVASQFSPIIHGVTHLEMLVGKNKIIGSIENTRGADLRKKNRMKSAIFLLTIGGLIAIYAILMAHDIVFGESPMMWI
jgi:polysaccharide chain length determinant protein (PEP-CTERM system associated)